MSTKSLGHLEGLNERQRAQLEDCVEAFEQAWTKKTPVMVLVERDGSARAKPVQFVDRRTLQVEILRHVHGQSTIMTDEFGAYRGIGFFYGGRHATVNHGSNEYARRADGLSIHVNTAESFNALIKRGHYGSTTK
jgi:hypothetical protein